MLHLLVPCARRIGPAAGPIQTYLSDSSVHNVDFREDRSCLTSSRNQSPDFDSGSATDGEEAHILIRSYGIDWRGGDLRDPGQVVRETLLWSREVNDHSSLWHEAETMLLT